MSGVQKSKNPSLFCGSAMHQIHPTLQDLLGNLDPNVHGPDHRPPPKDIAGDDVPDKGRAHRLELA